MEAAFYFTDVGLTVLVFYWLVKNALRRPGEPTSGLFAYYDVLVPKQSRQAQMIAARRADAPDKPRARH